MLNLEKSSQAFAQAKEVMPGGVNSPVRSFARVKCDPPFIAKASGSKIYDIDGNEVKLRLKGYPAIVFQHEIDHLNGVMFYDHINQTQPMYIPKGAVVIGE